MSNPTELPDLDREKLRVHAFRIFEQRHWVTDEALDGLVSYIEGVASARRAQPEGEAHGAEAQVFFGGTWKPASEEAFYCTSEKNRRVLDRPEGEAPQADFRELHYELNRITWEGEDEGWNLAIAAVQKRIREMLGVPASSAEEAYSAKLAKRGASVAEVRAAERVEAMHRGVVGVFAAIKEQHAATPAATLSPLCGAQHAERGEPHGFTIGEAFKAVGGWMNGGELGYPSFGSMNALLVYTQKMVRAALAAQQAAAPGALEKSARALAEKWHKDAVDTGFATSEAAVELLEVLDAAPSTPGTPEAPKGGA